MNTEKCNSWSICYSANSRLKVYKEKHKSDIQNPKQLQYEYRPPTKFDIPLSVREYKVQVTTW